MQTAHGFELRHLAAFVAVADAGGVGAAAQMLARSQPSVTRQVQDLERLLGVALFDRTGRSLRLTDAGRVLLEDARRTMAAADRTTQRARAAARGELGELSIGFGGAAINGLLGRALGDLGRRTDVRLRLVERFDDAELTQMVASGELDACVVRFPAADKRLHVEAVTDEPFAAVLATDHQLSGRTALTLGELAGEPFVLWPRNTAPDAYDAIVLACASAGFAPRVVQETMSVGALLALVAARIGVSLLATSFAALRRDGVRFLDVSDAPVAQLHLVTRTSETQRPLLAALRTQLHHIKSEKAKPRTTRHPPA